jgi:hypothetical protein
MRTNAQFNLHGKLRVTVKDLNGKTLKTFVRKNKIVFDGVKSVLNLLKQDGFNPLSNYQITELRVGTSSYPTSFIDTGLVSPVPEEVGGVLPIGSGERLLSYDTSEMVITKILGPTAAIGYSLSEAALITADGRCFARTTYLPIPKTDMFTVVYEWHIYLTVE